MVDSQSGKMTYCFFIKGILYGYNYAHECLLVSSMHDNRGGCAISLLSSTSASHVSSVPKPRFQGPVVILTSE